MVSYINKLLQGFEVFQTAGECIKHTAHHDMPATACTTAWTHTKCGRHVAATITP